MNDWRKKIYDIIEPRGKDSFLSRAYDILMIAVIILCIIPLLDKHPSAVYAVFDGIAVTVFIIDYILRLITADYYYNDHSAKSFLRYPISVFAIVDLLSILPSVLPLHAGFKTVRLLRLFMALRVITLLRYSKSIQILNRVCRKQKEALLTVFGLAFGYIVVTSIIMFQIEPAIFDTYWDALYWATVSLTTVGYGDVTAATLAGRLFTVLSTFVGIAVIALPTGVVTAGYLEELRVMNEEKENK